MCFVFFFFFFEKLSGTSCGVDVSFHTVMRRAAIPRDDDDDKLRRRIYVSTVITESSLIKAVKIPAAFTVYIFTLKRV